MKKNIKIKKIPTACTYAVLSHLSTNSITELYCTCCLNIFIEGNDSKALFNKM